MKPVWMKSLCEPMIRALNLLLRRDAAHVQDFIKTPSGTEPLKEAVKLLPFRVLINDRDLLSLLRWLLGPRSRGCGLTKRRFRRPSFRQSLLRERPRPAIAPQT